ncbi:hypothetical protein KDL01_07535 [Actinospica durhamensis]|uniref:Periplasmic copper-binding protein NosD beta helix domain-containing protein n=1 Tax=Actinospica durhamensis TaxID=1508375 RepID=A0A941ELH3_9ACTN|nr:NosD domain-containing protein [Actinospica durhamensis]MBR7833110.1 hypothetical protein [Actinospica durhamensis]
MRRGAAGHTVSGGGQGVGIAIGFDQPVQQTGDEVENGSLENLGDAVNFGDVGGTVFSHLRITDAASGGPVFRTRDGEVGGYTILDSSITTPVGEYLTYASIEDTPGFTLENSTVDGGQYYLSQTAGPLFERDTFTDVPMTFDNEGGIRASDSSFLDSPIYDGPDYADDDFSYDTFSGAGTAVDVWSMQNETFTHDVFSADGVGLELDGDYGATVTDSVFSDDGEGAADSSNENTGAGGGDVFTSDTFTHDSGGLGMYSIAGDTVSDDSFTDDGLGVYMEYPSSDTITRDRFVNDAMYGLYAWEQYPGGGSPIGLTVSDDVAVHDGHQPGTWTDPEGDAVVGAFFIYAPDGGVTVQDDHTADDGGWGIFLVPGAPDTLASGNVSSHDANGCNPATACAYH